MKRCFTLLMAVALLVSLCTAASAADANFNPTGYPIVNEPVTYKTLTATDANLATDWNDYTVNQYLSEYTNVYFDYEYISSSDWSTQISLRLISGNIPDLILPALSMDQLQMYGVEGGMFLNYADYLDYMPNMVAAFEKYPDLGALGKMIDGSIYSLARNVWTYTMGTPIFYRDDMLTELGVAQPTTIDEFYDVLVAAKEHFKDIEGFYPIVSQMDYININLFPAFGDAWQVGGLKSSTGFGDTGDGKVSFNYMSDQWRLFLAFFNKIYAEGLIDPEMFTLDGQQVTAKVKAGQCMYIGYNGGTALTPDYFKSGKVEVKTLQPLVSEYTDEMKTIGINSFSLAGRLINANVVNPEPLLRFFDMFFTEIADATDGICGITTWLGIKGVDWDITEDGQSYYRILPEDRHGMSEEEYKNKYVIGSNYMGLVVLDLFPVNNPTQEMFATQNALNWNPYMKYRLLDNVFKYTEDESSRLNSLMTDIITYVDTASSQFVSGAVELTDESWQSYLATLESMGIEEILAIKQVGYDRWLAK